MEVTNVFGVPPNATPLHACVPQAAGSNLTATAAFAGAPGRTNYLLGFVFEVGSAATAGTVTATISGLLTNLTSKLLTWTTTQGDRVVVMFGPTGIPASAQNLAIQAQVPATGATGPAITCEIWGYQL